jgi:hypothetical protein
MPTCWNVLDSLWVSFRPGCGACLLLCGLISHDLWALGMIFAVPRGQEWVSSYNYRLDVCREVYIEQI